MDFSNLTEEEKERIDHWIKVKHEQFEELIEFLENLNYKEDWVYGIPYKLKFIIVIVEDSIKDEEYDIVYDLIKTFTKKAKIDDRDWKVGYFEKWSGTRYIDTEAISRLFRRGYKDEIMLIKSMMKKKEMLKQ